jgi:hypothetical protein
MSSELEWRAASPEMFISELEEAVRQRRENKYAFQVGLKDLGFEIDEDQARAWGVTLPFQNIDQAEQALRERVIKPTTFLEDDDTAHQVAAFDPQPVGFSGFMSCVTHSLAVTDLGLFEVGHYPAMNLASQGRYWQWFLHRRLATSEQVAAWREQDSLTNHQVVEQFFEAMTGRARGKQG